MPALARGGTAESSPSPLGDRGGGSSDATLNVAEMIAAEYDWARLVVLPATARAPQERGAPVVRALHAGLDSPELEPDFVVNVDAAPAFRCRGHRLWRAPEERHGWDGTTR
jgi:hypothetical protein